MKTGDKVIILSSSQYQGKEEGIITCMYPTGGDQAWYVKVGGVGGGIEVPIYERELRLINNKMSMNIKDKFTLAFKKEPEKSFRKVGITNGDDFLTEDGRNVFESWLLKKFGEDFKKEVVDDLLKDLEIEKTK